MIVLLLHSGSDLYGSGRILADVVRALVAHDHDCRVILPDQGPLERTMEDAGARVEVMDLGVLRRRYGSVRGALDRVRALSRAVFALRRLLRAEKIDLVYSNTTAVLAGALAARLTRVPHLWHVHEIVTAPVVLARGIAWAVRHLSDGAAVVSGPVKQFIATGGRARVSVIHNGIDPAPYEAADGTRLRRELGLGGDALVIGMVGRVHYWKGQDYFLKIAARIRSRYPEARFVMAGDAFPGYEWLYERIAAQRRSLGLEDAVLDLGFRGDVPEVLAALDLFILPSTLPDPLPTVVLEAMAASRPVAATGHGGSLEMVVHGVTGYHIPWDDESRAFDIILPLLESRSLRESMGRMGNERVREKFSMAAFQEQIASFVATIPRGLR